MSAIAYSIKSNIWMRRGIYCGVGCLVFGLISLIALMIFGLRAYPKPADICVIYGTRVLSNNQPSRALQERLDQGLSCYQRQLCRILFVSGGIEPSGNDEAQVMKTYLEAKGVPSDAIIADSEGKNTWFTAKNITAYAREHHIQRVIAISHFYHLPRAMMVLQRHGITEVSGDYPHQIRFADFYFAMRELTGIPWYTLRQDY